MKATREHILAVGDLHGCLGLLKRVINEALPQTPSSTQMVFLGDYVDRGPDSAGVVDQLMALKAARPDTVLLMGNHERMLLNALAGIQVEMFLDNGGEQTLRSYGLDRDGLRRLPQAHLDFLGGLPLLHQSQDYIFVHAGLRPGVPLASQVERDLLWIRHEFIDARPDFGRPVVFGHTPLPRPLITRNIMGIDTGAVYGNMLTCLKLPEKRVFSLS